MDEFDELEDHYFSKKRDPNAMKEARLRGLYEYTLLLRVPDKPSTHVPYRLLAQLASTAPENSVEDYVCKRLANYGLLKEEPSSALLKRIRWARAWVKREGAVEGGEGTEDANALDLGELSEKQVNALRDLAQALPGAKTADEVQSAAFTAMRSNGLQAGEFFPIVYGVLLGSQKGPKIGSVHLGRRHRGDGRDAAKGAIHG